MHKFSVVLVTFERQYRDAVGYLVAERPDAVVDDEHLVERPVLDDPEVFDGSVVKPAYTLLRMLQCSRCSRKPTNCIRGSSLFTTSFAYSLLLDVNTRTSAIADTSCKISRA